MGRRVNFGAKMESQNRGRNLSLPAEPSTEKLRRCGIAAQSEVSERTRFDVTVSIFNFWVLKVQLFPIHGES